MYKIIALLVIAVTFAACSPKLKHNQVLFKTNKGDILIQLYDETPKHRDNFLKLANEGFYDQLLFHRVIKDFMIQGGDPDSKGAEAGKQLGNGGPGYTIDAEIDFPKLFHKKGALAAARMGDNVNPEKQSSGSQFYIVEGKKLNDEDFEKVERRLNSMQRQNLFYKTLEGYKDTLMSLRKSGDQQEVMNLQMEINEIVEKKAQALPKISIPEDIKEVYRTIGGVPHLDGNYTVFGEVIEGLDVVDSIASVKCDQYDRPLDDVIIEKVLTSK